MLPFRALPENARHGIVAAGDVTRGARVVDDGGRVAEVHRIASGAVYAHV